MKTFWAVFGAILAAALIIWVVFSLVSTGSEWTGKKEEMVRGISQTTEELNAIADESNSEKSVAQLEEKLHRIRELQNLRQLQFKALVAVLERKPFFGLDNDEQQLLHKAKTELGEPEKDHTVPANTPTLPATATITLATWAVDQDHNEVQLLAGTKVKVLTCYGPNLIFEYEGKRYSLPSAITDVRCY